MKTYLGITNGAGRRRNAPNEGMSLRDWFAGQALAGLLARGTDDYAFTTNDRDDCRFVAERAYAVADAMLEARKK